MSNSAKSRELLKRYSIARIPFIAVNTIEPGRALAILQSIAEELMRKLQQKIAKVQRDY